jgi:uncharacterized membrane protein YedE/YeeE
MGFLRENSWSPYAVGAGIGLLEIAAIITARKPLGITSAFEDAVALAARAVAPDAMNIAAYERARGEAPRIGWETTLVTGVLVGSATSARLSGARSRTRMPELWRRHVGGSTLGRQAAALTGGALMMFGARMAMGCTTGHGISGNMQFAASSSLFTAIMFGTAGAVARAVFGRES